MKKIIKIKQASNECITEPWAYSSTFNRCSHRKNPFSRGKTLKNWHGICFIKFSQLYYINAVMLTLFSNEICFCWALFLFGWCGCPRRRCLLVCCQSTSVITNFIRLSIEYVVLLNSIMHNAQCIFAFAVILMEYIQINVFSSSR